MNKKELISVVATKASLTKKGTKKALDAIAKTVEEAIGKGDNVKLLGFGTFTIIEKKSRKGINPKTKEPITIPAHKVVKFKVSPTFAKAEK
jgi:DNA-binding protein HU-beta